MSEMLVELQNITNNFGSNVVHQDLNFSVEKGEIVAVIGPSGCGKTTLFNTLLLLNTPVSGQVKLFGEDVHVMSPAELLKLRSRWGVLFQSGALFSSMTVLDNIIYPMATFTQLKKDVMNNLARIKIALVGLEQNVAELYPSELSGGMVKRVAMARALALDPELVILDEPTAGLDPDSASELDQLVLTLRGYLNLTVVMVTHDLESLSTVPDRICFMGEGKIIANSPLAELVQMGHPLIEQYFSSDRAQRLIKNG
jgi:phospholipid/cholesterol/gamma-HCH transport system ATP-binding protein